MAGQGYGSLRSYSPNDDSGFERERPRRQGGGSFFEYSDTISSNIFNISTNTTALERLVKQIGTGKDGTQLRDKIHETEQNTNRLIKQTAQAFHKLSGVVTRSNRQEKLQMERLKNEFQEAAERYNALQKKVADKVRTVAPPQPKPFVKDLISWQEADASDERSLVEEERRRQQAQLQAQGETIDTDLELLQEREEQIRRLEGDILDINTIFKDLSLLVHEQGETIDTIESNVEQASGNVEAGRDQLSQAANYQRRARKKVCVLIIILTIIAGVLALVIYLAVR